MKICKQDRGLGARGVGDGGGEEGSVGARGPEPPPKREGELGEGREQLQAERTVRFSLRDS